MTCIQCKTKGNSTPNGKPRVYFTCHPDDFARYFDTICEDIFQTHNCAIYYIENGGEAVPGDDKSTDLGTMNLFVIPVTRKFLNTPNPALDEDFRFAIQHHIPVLPLMQESGLEELFNRICGDLQFLDKHIQDTTAISYEKKLENFLNSVLIGDEMAEKIRAAFDAYVFLSYRKKDRKYANELMRLIHRNDFCRDIAIWYDEFLIPGENFNDSIQDALQKSDLFVLAVTPNLVNEVNYIMTTEYPMALESGKPILPAEMVPTDKILLSDKYQSLPDCTNAHDESALSRALLDAVKRLAIQENDHSPEHNFFIGLAYLGGIDMEVDHARAVELITSAAEAGLMEAVKKLMEMYRTGLGVTRNYETSMIWNEKLLKLLETAYHEEPTSKNLALLLDGYQLCGDSYKLYGNIPEAKNKYSQCIFTYMNLRATLENDKMLLAVLDVVNNCSCRLAGLLRIEGDLDTALKYYENALNVSKLLKKILDGMNINPLRSKQSLACLYLDLGAVFYQKKNFSKAKANFEQAYTMWEELVELEDSAIARQCLAICCSNLGDTYMAEGNTRRAGRYYTDGMELHSLASEELNTPDARSYLADAHGRLGDIYFSDGNLTEAHANYQKRFEITEEIAKTTKIQRHQRSLAYSCLALGKVLTASRKIQQALDFYKQSIAIYLELAKATASAQSHADLAAGYENIGTLLFKLELSEKAKTYFQKAVDLREPLLQKSSLADNLMELAHDYDCLGDICRRAKNISEARLYYEKALHLREKAQNPENSSTIRKHLTMSYERMGDLFITEEKPADACVYYRKSLAIYEGASENSPANFAILYGKIADAMVRTLRSSKCSFQERTENTSAILEYYEKAVAIQEKLVATSRTGDNLENLAITYCHMADVVFFKKKYFKKALALYEELCHNYPDIPKYRKGLESLRSIL